MPCTRTTSTGPPITPTTLPGLGTSAKRENEAAINLAHVDFALEPAPVGFKLALGFGTATEVVHAAEARGIAAHPDIWRNGLQASVPAQTTLGRGLLLEAGVYPSHIGMEAFATQDNWNYTCSWLGELSPYYQAGLNVTDPLSDRRSAHAHVGRRPMPGRAVAAFREGSLSVHDLVFVAIVLLFFLLAWLYVRACERL